MDHRKKLRTSSTWKPIEPMSKSQLTAKKRLDAKLKGAKRPAAAKPKSKAKALAKPKAKAGAKKDKMKKEKKEKAEKKNKNKKNKDEKVGWNAETDYGVAKRLFKGQYAGPKKDFEKCWRQSDTCQRILKSMTTGELKRRRFENWLIQ